MLYEKKNDFITEIGEAGKLLGLDVGSKTIGVAISDATRTVASPLETINRKKFSIDIKLLEEVIKQNSIAGLVVGLPINMQGEDTPQTQSVRQFARNILKEFDIPILFWDERFSSSAVEKTLIEADMSRAKRAKVIDKMAASYILQGFLDSV